MATKTAALVRMSPPRPVAPIIRVSAPRSPAKPKTKHRRRHGSASLKTKTFGVAAAAFALGMIDKSSFAIPTLPFLGRAGTIAAGLYFFAPKGGIWDELTIAAAAVAGYEMGNKGSISGDIVARQVTSGVASQV